MSEMIDRIAREMREKYNAEFCSGGELVPFEHSKARDAWRACATAAIQAMREPNEGMKDAGMDAIDHVDAWVSMIDAILTDKEPRG